MSLSLPAAVALVARVIERRSSIPIISNLLVDCDGKNVTFIGTDLDDQVSVTLPFKGPKLLTTVEGHRLKEIIEHLDGIEGIHFDGNRLVVGGGPTFRLNTLPSDKFPSVKMDEATSTFELPAAQLLADLAAVAPAICTEETRYYLNGVNIETCGDKLSFAATDWHRLHILERDPPKGAENLGQSIVRRKPVSIIRAAIEALPDVASVKMSFSKSKAKFEIGPVTITTKLIDGTYPDVRRVIPKATRSTLSADADALLASVQAARLVSSDKIAYVKLDFAAGLVSAKSPDGASVTAEMPGERDGDLPAAIGFNVKYLATICEHFAGRRITLAAEDAANPVLITSDGHPLVTVLMPVRL